MLLASQNGEMAQKKYTHFSRCIYLNAIFFYKFCPPGCGFKTITVVAHISLRCIVLQVMNATPVLNPFTQRGLTHDTTPFPSFFVIHVYRIPIHF